MFGRNNGSAGWVAVDAGPEGIYGVTVRPAAKGIGRPQVLKCGFVADPDTGPLAMSILAKKIGVSRFRWTVPLNRGDYKIMVLPEPPVDPSEMGQSVRWSLGTMIDYPVEEAVIDWMSIPTRKHQPQRPPHLYAIVAQSQVVNFRIEPFRRAKINVNAVDIRETAQRNIAALVAKPGEGICMIALSNVGVEITFTYEGELYLDRYMEEPLETLISGDEESRARVLDRITLQVQRSLDFVKRTLAFVRIGRVLIAPLPAPIPLREHLARNISEPVESLDLGTVFDLSAVPELRDEETQARFFVPLGAALRTAEKRA